MTIVAFSPARVTTAILLHYGDLRSNLDGAAPAQFAGVQDNVVVPAAPAAPTLAATQYVPPDAGVIVGSGYDELYVDVQPLVRANGSVGAVGATTQNAFRQIAMTDRPYWIVVRTDGYGIAALQTRASALATALAVVAWAQQHALACIMTRRLAGFAFLAPDLNVIFPDGTVIDRLFQNQLVQACWNLNCACTFVTSRPADATCIVGPPVTNDAQQANPNAGATLPYSILGANPALRDRIVVRYPVAQATGQSPGVVAGMLAGVLGTRGRDPGYALNLDAGFVTPVAEPFYAPDGVIGTTDPLDWLADVHAFAAAMGVATLGVEGTAYVLPAERFLPPDALVNTTGMVRASSTAGIVTVEYPDVTGTTSGIARQFDASFNEVTAVT